MFTHKHPTPPHLFPLRPSQPVQLGLVLFDPPAAAHRARLGRAGPGVIPGIPLGFHMFSSHCEPAEHCNHTERNVASAVKEIDPKSEHLTRRVLQKRNHFFFPRDQFFQLELVLC